MAPRKSLEFGLLAAIAVLPANADVNQSWEKLVATVKVGRSVVVKRMDSIQIEGKLLAISADSITVEYYEQRYVFVRAHGCGTRAQSTLRRDAGAAAERFPPGCNNPVGFLYSMVEGSDMGDAIVGPSQGIDRRSS